MATPTLPPVLTESAALRALDLPNTRRWRGWLRERLAHVEGGGGYIYAEREVAALAARAGAGADAGAGRLHDRRGPSAG